MPNVSSNITIAAPVDRVYAIARDVERFPEFMADVESVEILEQTPERQVSRWVSLIKEFNRHIKWTEVDYWDDVNKTCRWELLEGDLSRFDGGWKFVAQDEATTSAELEIEYEYNVPLIGNLIQGILKKKMQDNVESMLAGIKSEAEAG
jgi:uncharacterized membrane protein